MMNWTLTIETRNEGSTNRPRYVDYAILHEPGKMDTWTPIYEGQLSWFNALRTLIEEAA